MFDNWNGEIGYMKINGKILWSKIGISNKNIGMNICGNEKYNDPAFNINIDINFPHNEENLEVSFGSTLNKDPCEASYGVGNVMIFAK